MCLIVQSAQALGGLSNLCDCPSSLFYSQWFPVIESVVRPVGDLRGRVSISTQIQADWKIGTQAAALKYANTHSPVEPQVSALLATRAKQSSCVLWVAVTKIMPDTSSFLVTAGEPAMRQSGSAKMASLSLCPLSVPPQAARWEPNQKLPRPRTKTSKQAPSTERLWVGFSLLPAQRLGVDNCQELSLQQLLSPWTQRCKPPGHKGPDDQGMSPGQI